MLLDYSVQVGTSTIRNSIDAPLDVNLSHLFAGLVYSVELQANNRNPDQTIRVRRPEEAMAYFESITREFEEDEDSGGIGEEVYRCVNQLFILITSLEALARERREADRRAHAQYGEALGIRHERDIPVGEMMDAIYGGTTVRRRGPHVGESIADIVASEDANMFNDPDVADGVDGPNETAAAMAAIPMDPIIGEAADADSESPFIRAMVDTPVPQDDPDGEEGVDGSDEAAADVRRREEDPNAQLRGNGDPDYNENDDDWDSEPAARVQAAPRDMPVEVEEAQAPHAEEEAAVEEAPRRRRRRAPENPDQEAPEPRVRVVSRRNVGQA